MIDLTADLTDFGDTAALVSCLDFVITVDTGVARLGGALGRPTWILLPYRRTIAGCSIATTAPGIRRHDCSGRAKRDYGEVLDRVRSALRAQIAERKTADIQPLPDGLLNFQRALELDPRDWEAA